MHNSDRIPSAKELQREEKSVEDHAIAFHRKALFDELVKLKGLRLGDWEVVSLHAIGGVGVLFRVTDQTRWALMKMPSLPYDRPAHFGADDIAQRRDKLVYEAHMLEALPGSLFPEFLALQEAGNPLLTGRPPEITETEQYLIMEFIAGRPFDLEVQARLGSGGPGDISRLLARWQAPLLQLILAIKLMAPPLFYTDFKPANLRVGCDDRLRLLDAGSLCCTSSSEAPPMSQGYYLPEFLGAEKTEALLEALSVVALGRALYAAVGNKVLHDGADLEFESVASTCGEEWAEWIENASRGTWAKIEQLVEFLPKGSC